MATMLTQQGIEDPLGEGHLARTLVQFFEGKMVCLFSSSSPAPRLASSVLLPKYTALNNTLIIMSRIDCVCDAIDPSMLRRARAFTVLRGEGGMHVNWEFAAGGHDWR